MIYDTTLADQAYALADKWDATRGYPVSELPFKADDLKEFNGNQISEFRIISFEHWTQIAKCLLVVFLEHLASYEPLPPPHIHRLAEVYSLNITPNAEIRLRWYTLVLGSNAAKDFVNDAVDWLVNGKEGVLGRMKFCRTTFRAINVVDPELARKSFLEHEFEFHPIAATQIRKVDHFEVSFDFKYQY